MPKSKSQTKKEMRRLANKAVKEGQSPQEEARQQWKAEAARKDAKAKRSG